MAYLTMEGRKAGSLERETLAGSLLQKKLNERGIFLSATKRAFILRDTLFPLFSGDGAARTRYSDAARERFTVEHLAEGTNESLLRELFALRASLFGRAPYDALWKGGIPAPDGVGLDQRKLTETLRKKNALLFYLSSPEEADLFRRDLERAAREGKRAFCLVFPDDPVLPDEETLRRLAAGAPFTPLPMSGQNGCCDLAAVPEDPELKCAVAAGDAAFFAYGEDAFLCCRALTLPAAAAVTPQGLFARALVGLFTEPRRSFLYIPAGYDLTPFVPAARPSRQDFYHLAALTDRIGEKAYSLSPQDCARLLPGAYFRFYDDHLPFRETDGAFSGGDLSLAREKYWQEKLAALPGVRAIHACFDKATWKKVQPDWNAAQPRDHLLVDGVVAAPGTRARVLTMPEKATSPRKIFFRRREKGKAILSNFTFFFTPKLVASYNALRRDRPKEAIASYAGFVDYARRRENGKWIETIPLYRKMCLAAGKGGFRAFPFEAGGGTVTLSRLRFRWEKENVNGGAGEVTLFTPMLSKKDENADPLSYVLTVGAGALNVVILGSSVLCVREGEVALPCAGAVLSLKGGAAARLRRKLPPPDKDGYSDASSLSLSIRMDPPEGILREEWEGFDWVFGGGMGLFDRDGEITYENYLDRFAREGWLTPLSQQTQESALHTLARHPRTAVGVTKKGELVILVYSGRSAVSAGADYPEMVRAARILVPDADVLINWDGGGSSVLGILEGDIFTELNLPAPSDGSVAGMARAVSSLIFLKIKEK